MRGSGGGGGNFEIINVTLGEIDNVLELHLWFAAIDGHLDLV